MNPDLDFRDEDEGTWHQPAPGPGLGRPHDQPTVPDGPMETDQEEKAAAAPESTRAEVTSPSGEVSQVAHDRAPTCETGTHDAQKTQTVDPEGSGDWDATPPPVFVEGQVVFGKYRLIKKIGEGGMGEVWRVWHVGLKTERALKLIKAEYAHNTKGWKRFEREAQLMAKIDHPNAVAVYDFDRKQSVGYIEMQFVRGQSLAELLRERHDQPMPLSWTAQILDQLCAVLQEAHGYIDEEDHKPKPIIHRDLKPSNLMLVQPKHESDPPRLKVLDFGIAKMVEDEGGGELTGAGDLVGTPAYMSPEQIRGGYERDGQKQELDGRSDIYSTGVVLYHLLTGTLPFRGSKMALLGAHLSNPPMPMKEANPKVEMPPEVEHVVMQCLEKDPARRPQTARELAAMFQKAAGVVAVVPPRPPAAVPSWWVRVAVASVLLFVVTGAIIPYFRSRPGTVPSQEQSPPIPDTPKSQAQAKDILPTPPPSWPPRGYVAVDPGQTVPDRPDLPSRLKRQDDEIIFYHLRDELYLPVGYVPESQENAPGAEKWPQVIVRERDKVRFLRIPGATYLRGDPRQGEKAPDLDNHPMKSHYVKVPGFYIQETEVTNAEMERYDQDHPEDSADLQKWKDFYREFRTSNQIGKDKTGRYPAVRIGYRLARKYARSVGGLLPTEAEWEWAAKSCQETYWFAWGAKFSDPDQPLKVHLSNPDTLILAPIAVGTSPDDETLQHVRDLVGNVSELCADVARPYSSLHLGQNSPRHPLIDERPPVDLSAVEPGGGQVKVIVRGGSYVTSEKTAMAFLRSRQAPDDISSEVGFRVVIECPSRSEASRGKPRRGGGQ
ncbi:MAG TPA: bifunctional serine/threonine-protein kinase/formylglycine-generating enzyme family protein [Isosphaeraceae bacterium]|nr:bifunctional serine/threonine-protein kinase/formylglycine-generating enzyme family protein [Isosphaeraceae bacterium]